MVRMIITLKLHSVETGYFCRSDFTVKSISGIWEVPKTAILSHFEALKSDFHEFLHFVKAGIDQSNKIKSPKKGKKAIFRIFSH